MADENYVENIRNFILSNKKPSYQTTNRKEVRVRCPYCGDSKSNQSSAHMYIEMRPPFRFHCFKCETSGVLNQSVLRDLGLYDNDTNVSIINANKNYKATTGIQKVSFKRLKLNNEPINSEITERNLKYFNSRYELNFSKEFVSSKFKCILDPPAFFEKNKIYVPEGQYDFLNAIGFISSDSSHIIFRDTSGRQPKRYYNLNLCQDDEGSIISKAYNISNNLNIMSKVNLVITEGIFDIIGVFSHFYQNENGENTIFAAACGKAYNAVILNYLRMGFLDMDITIFSDGDVDMNFYKSLKTSSPYLKNLQITVFYNSLYDKETGYGKDYGIPKKDIQLKKIII